MHKSWMLAVSAAIGVAAAMYGVSEGEVDLPANMRVAALVVLALLEVYLLVVLRQNRHSAAEPTLWFTWLPYLGAGLAMGIDATKFINRVAGECGEMFKTHLAGNDVYFVTNPNLYPEVMKRTQDFSFEPIATDVMRTGFDYHTPGKGEPAAFPAEAVHNVYIRHLKNKGGVDHLSERVRDAFADIIPREAARLAAAPGEPHGDLYEFVRAVVMQASTRAAINTPLSSDAIYQSFVDFDTGFAPLVAGVPIKFFPKVRRSLYKIIDTVCAPDTYTTASDFFKARGDLFEKSGMTPLDAAKQQAAMVWAVNANTAPTAFWALYFIHTTGSDLPALLASEVAAAMRKAGGDLAVAIGDMPLLDSCLEETLRLSSGSMIMRVVERDTTMVLESGRQVELHAGCRLACYPPQLHFNPEVFAKPTHFVYDRFLAGREFFLQGKKLPSPTFPFGGGISMCPGRTFAKNDVKVYIADMLTKFELSIPGHDLSALGTADPSFPGFDASRLGLGILPPPLNKKVRFVLKPRA